MKYINLTPHVISIYTSTQFVGLKQTNSTNWVADGVKGNPILEVESSGCARISVCTEEIGIVGDGVLIAHSTYGDAVGFPSDVTQDDVLIVSLRLQLRAKMIEHPLAKQLVSPYKVVRSADDGNIVLGAMGFTY